MIRWRSINLTRALASVLGAFALGAVCRGVGAQPPAKLADVQPYLRPVKGTNGVATLEVALRRLAPVRGAGPAIWMVAVTHIATTNYYAQLQRFLDAQPLVLFEAVRTEEGKIPKHREGYSLQADLAHALGLTFQLDEIDYDRPNFRNSDLNLEQLTRILAANTNAVSEAGAGEGKPAAGSIEFGALVQAMNGEGLVGGLARLGVSVLASSTRLQAATKVALIEVLGRLPNDMSQIAGLPAGMQRLLRVLVEERNAAVVRDLRAALAKKPAPKSVGVFYGAGHMADLEFRVCQALGYAPVEDRWLTAFDVNPRALGISEFEVELTSRLVRMELQGLERTLSEPSSSESPAAPKPAADEPTASPPAKAGRP